MSVKSLEADDRRQYQRIETEGGAVELVRDGLPSVEYIIVNLSEGGALLKGAIVEPVGAAVQLVVTLPGVAGVPVRAKVVRHERHPEGEYIAVCFNDPAARLRAAVQELVLQALRVAFPDCYET